MAKKTNKTSHVLNLITNGEPEIAKEPEEPAPNPSEEEKSATKDTKVTVVNVDKENSEVSEEIQKQLLNQLPEEKVEEITETMEEFELPEDVTELASDEMEEEPEEEYHMVNVMESVIKRSGLVKHMKEYGVCTCSRCQADVMALVLTRLPAKYVIVDETAANPMISYYESKFKMRILTETIKSCMDVRDNPRHDSKPRE